MTVGEDRWVAVGLDQQVQAASSNPVILDGHALAVWRTAQGPVQVWEDRCPHRGMRLSFGFVRDETLRCIYHGWTYGTNGQCVKIPAHPTLTPPRTICAKTYRAETRYGIVWTNLAETPATDLPDIGADEGWVPLRSIYAAASLEKTGQVLKTFDFGPGSSLQMITPDMAVLKDEDGLDLLFAIQPVSADKTAIHAVARGQTAAIDRVGLATQMTRLRTAIEQSEEART